MTRFDVGFQGFELFITLSYVLHHHILQGWSPLLLLRPLIMILRAFVHVLILILQVRRHVHILVLTQTLPLISPLFPREVWVISPPLVVGIRVEIITNTLSTSIVHFLQGLGVWAVSNHMSCLPTLLTDSRWRCVCHHLHLSRHPDLHLFGQHIYLLFKRRTR